MEIGLVAVKPGSCFKKVPGITGDTQRVNITIE